MEKTFELALVYTGHMTDAPGRKEPRFPAEMSMHVASEVYERVKAHWWATDDMCMIGSGARGADIIFGELAQGLFVPHHLVFPHNIELFKKMSIGEPNHYSWERRLDTLIELADSTNFLEGTGEFIEYHNANMAMLGLAETLADKTLVMALWDGKGGDDIGGTEHFLNEARSRGCQIEVINCERLLKEHTESLGYSSYRGR